MCTFGSVFHARSSYNELTAQVWSFKHLDYDASKCLVLNGLNLVRNRQNTRSSKIGGAFRQGFAGISSGHTKHLVPGQVPDKNLELSFVPASLSHAGRFYEVVLNPKGCSHRVKAMKTMVHLSSF